MNYLLFIL